MNVISQFKKSILLSLMCSIVSLPEGSKARQPIDDIVSIAEHNGTWCGGSSRHERAVGIIRA